MRENEECEEGSAGLICRSPYKGVLPANLGVAVTRGNCTEVTVGLPNGMFDQVDGPTPLLDSPATVPVHLLKQRLETWWKIYFVSAESIADSTGRPNWTRLL